MGVATGVKINDRKITSRRYGETENGFLKEFLERGGNVTVTELARQLGVARSTFYYHHKNLLQFIRDHRICIFEDYLRMVQEILDKGATMMNLFLGILVFMINHRQIFQILVRVGVKDVLVEMVVEVRPQIEKYAGLSCGAERIFKVYAYEVAGVLRIWVENGLCEEDMDRVLKDLMHLTKTINERLGFLGNG